MEGFATQKVLGDGGEALVLASPFALALIEEAQADLVVFLCLVLELSKADSERCVQLGDGVALDVLKSDVQGSADQNLPI